MKRYSLFVLPVLFFSLLTLWPSFNLHLTGDDYLGLWRYRYYIEGHTPLKWNSFNFLFTDYGPQDTITAVIHHFVGWGQPRVYYIISFVLRFIAALSFFPVVQYLTKNTRAAYFSMIFFTVCAAGLETTDWSFNMPSYIAIAVLNTFLLVYLRTRDDYSLSQFILTGLLFYLTLVSQPIRMTFLPVFVITFELYSIVKHIGLHSIKQSIIRISMFVSIAICFYLTGFVGNSVGAGETFEARVNGGWLKVIGNNMAVVKPYLERGEYQIFAYPITQLGSVIFPTHLIPTNYQLNTFSKALYKLTIPLFLMFTTAILLYQTTILSKLGDKLFTPMYVSDKKRATRKIKNQPLFDTNKDKIRQLLLLFVPLVSGIAWTSYSFFTFIAHAQYPFNKSQYISLLLGGYALVFLGYLFFKNIRDERLTQGIVLATLLTILAYITPWSRNPTFLFETTGRYLIVPGAGLTLLVGVLLGSIKQTPAKLLTSLAIFGLTIMHMYASHAYLNHLSTVRGIEMTEKIRRAVPNVKNINVVSEPKMFYVEPKDSEILHHSLIFGFPVIMGAQYDFFNVWQNALTDRWDEVEAAYKDGSSLKRFSIPVQRVKIENIYSFRLEGKTLVNTTEETRERLLEQFAEKPPYAETE